MTSRAAAISGPLGDAASSIGRTAQGQQQPALAQLRALAGVADSPQMPHHIGKSASELTDLASVPLSQWQFGNTGTAHAVWQADSTPTKPSPSGLSAVSGGDPGSAQSTPGFTGGTPAGGRAASPSWGPSEPPQPIHLEIKVLGDGDHSDRSPAASRAGSKADSVHDSPGQQSPVKKSAGAGSFGFEAGYGTHAGATNASHQSPSAASAAEDAASAGMHGGMTSKAPLSAATGISAGGGTDTDRNAEIGKTSAQAATLSASMQAPATAFGLNLNGTDAGPAASLTHQGLNPVSGAVAHGVHPVGSAGADELAEAAAQMAGSPWDPRQGPKLLESLSDFSSFNSSLSMLQQLAGKSAAGLATLGIGSSSSSSSQRTLEKKKSDKGHLISSAPTAWWRRRPGSAKKSAAPQVGSGLGSLLHQLILCMHGCMGDVYH